MIKKIFLRIPTAVISVCFFMPLLLCAKDTPVITWVKQFQERGMYIADVHQTRDGGYILGGSAPMDSSSNNNFYWAAKTDDTGAVEWEHTYYRTSGHKYYSDIVRSIQQTHDGGYVMFGNFAEDDSIVPIQTWIVKIDARGSVQWERAPDSTYYEEAIGQTSDGGFVVCGSGVILKLDSVGNTLWVRTLGNGRYDFESYIQQTRDKGYIVAGWAYSDSGGVIGHHGDSTTEDAWIVKLDSNGIMQWNKCYGGTSYDWANKILQTPDGGYLFIGNTYSFDGDVTAHHGTFNDTGYAFSSNLDGWIVKLNDTGSIEWSKCFGGSKYDDLTDFDTTFNGEYIVGGYTNSHDGDLAGLSVYEAGSGWLFQIDSSGDLEWEQTYNNMYGNSIERVVSTRDYGYLLDYGDINGVSRNNTLIKLDYPCNSDAIYFGAVELDSCKTDTLCFANTGNAPDTLTNIRLQGENAGRYSLRVTTFKILQPGERESIVFSFCPSAADTENATAALVIGTGDTVFVPLYGEGVKPLGVKEGVVDNSPLLIENYPNPFTTTTNIELRLPSEEPAAVKIYNVFGEQVADLTAQLYGHAIRFDALSAGIPTGTYFIRVVTRAGERVQPMLYVR